MPSYVLSHSPTHLGWLCDRRCSPTGKARVEGKQAPQYQHCCLKLAKAEAEATVTVCSTLLEGERPKQAWEGKRNKLKLKSSWGNTNIEVNCSVWGCAVSAKLVFNSPNKPRLGAVPHKRPTAASKGGLIVLGGRAGGLPSLCRCFALHGSRPEVAKGCRSVTHRVARYFLQQKEKVKHHMPTHAFRWLSVSKIKNACLLSCICNSSSFSIK